LFFDLTAQKYETFRKKHRKRIFLADFFLIQKDLYFCKESQTPRHTLFGLLCD